MALLAIAYPTLSTADRAWIQRIRQQYDAQVEMVAPHFTLVFPVFDVEELLFEAEMRRQAREHNPIHFEIHCAIVVKDALSNLTHTFLVPDQGFSELVKLHDKLYSNLLAPHLRLDIPFIPHITVASSVDATVCKRVADAINAEDRAVHGAVETLDIVQFANQQVTTLAQISLH